MGDDPEVELILVVTAPQDRRRCAPALHVGINVQEAREVSGLLGSEDSPGLFALF